MADFSGEAFRICTRIPSPIPPTPPAVIEAISDGPIEGGTVLTLIGGTTGGSPNTFIDTTRDDDFAGAVIDPAKWVASTAGSGTVVQNDGIYLETGIAVSSEAILTSFEPFDAIVEIQIDFSILTSVVRLPPADTTRFFDFELRIDANNYFRVSREYDASLPASDRHIFRITCVMGGDVVEDVVVPNDTRGGTLRLTRVRNRIIVRANSFVIYDGNPFSASADAFVVFRSVNPSLVNPYDFIVLLNNFRIPQMVLFGDTPGLVLEAAQDYIRVQSPEVLLPQTVSILVYLASGLLAELQDAFTYFLSYEFRIVSNASESVGIVSDRTMRNVVSGRSGFLT